MEPNRDNRQPSITEHAKALFAEIDLTRDVSNDTDIVADAYRRLSPAGGVLLSEPKELRSYGDRVRAFVREHLEIIGKLHPNRQIGRVGVLVHDVTLRADNGDFPRVHGLVELRDHSGRSAIVVGTRIFPVVEGCGMLRARLFEDSSILSLAPLVSPRAFAAEVERLRAAPQSAESFAALERSSVLFYLIRDTLAGRHGHSAAWHRELRRFDIQGGGESARFEFAFSAGQSFEVHAVHRAADCTISIESTISPR